MAQHTCDGRTFVEKSEHGRVVAFECPSCHALFHPLPIIDTDNAQVHWFAGRPSAALKKATSSPNLVHNLVAIGEQQPALYDAILFVRTDGP